MRILVHICCGPCAITVLERLLDQGHELTGLFFNPNIQPLAEYMRRREGAAQVAARLDIPLLFADLLPAREQLWNDSWLSEADDQRPLRASGPQTVPPSTRTSQADPLPPAVDPALWLRAVAGREQERCPFCWRMRLQKTADLARSSGFAGFTSSLLYSRYQKHDRIRELGERIAETTKLSFVYEDFRTSWQAGINLSKEWGIYRQQYCGCLFSEYDRYHREFARLRDHDARHAPLPAMDFTSDSDEKG